MLFKNYAFVVIVSVLVLTACSLQNSSIQVGQLLGKQTIEFSATLQTKEGYSTVFFSQEVEVSLVQTEYDVDCVVSDVDWASLDQAMEVIEQNRTKVNQEIENLFGGVSIIELDPNFNYGGYWSQDYYSDGNEESGYVCYDQNIHYEFSPTEHFEPATDEDGFQVGPTSILREAGDKFYLDLDNPHTGAHLGLSFDSDKFYALAEGVMMGEDSKLKIATSSLPTVIKNKPLEDLRSKEVASFVVAQEDYFSRDIFVQVIEAVLPHTVDVNSYSFAQGINQSGQVTHAEFSGSLDGSLIGMNFGGWGFITGGIEGATNGTLDSKPVLLVRGNIYVVPMP